MNAEPSFPRFSLFSTTIVAALATLIAIGLLNAVAFVFQRDGSPLAQLAAAERACVQHVYLSEREACMREWLAAAHDNRLARR